MTEKPFRKVGDPKKNGTTSAQADPPVRGLPFVLSLIAGSTDIIGFLGLNGLFTAHITGNLVILAARVIAGDPTVFSYMLSVPIFMLMLFLTRILAGGLQRSGLPTLWPLLLLQEILLAAFFLICVIASPWPSMDATPAVIAGMFAVAAMAVQNALVQVSLKSSPTTAVMTTNVTHFLLDLGELLVGSDPDEVGKARHRAAHTLPVIVGFTLGCGFGAACYPLAGLWSTAVPTALALLAFAEGLSKSRQSLARPAEP